MLIPLLITLVIAAIAVYVSVQVIEEICYLAAKLIAFGCLCLSLVFTPMLIKLLILVLLLLSHKPRITISQDLDFR